MFPPPRIKSPARYSTAHGPGYNPGTA